MATTRQPQRGATQRVVPAQQTKRNPAPSTTRETRATNELAKRETTTTARAADVAVPDYLKSEVGNRLGLENVDRSDTVIARLALAQSLSPQLKKTNAAYLPDLELGQLFNTATGEIYGDALDVIPLFFFKNRIKFHPIESGGGIDCQSLNGIDGGTRYGKDKPCDACQFAQFEDGAPECDKFLNFMSIVYRGPSAPLSASDLIVVSMKSTSIKVAKKWNAIVRMTNLPMFAKVYTISHAPESKGQNEWEQYVVAPREFVSREFFDAAKTFFENYREVNVEFDTRGMDAERPETGDEDWGDEGKRAGM